MEIAPLTPVASTPVVPHDRPPSRSPGAPADRLATRRGARPPVSSEGVEPPSQAAPLQAEAKPVAAPPVVVQEAGWVMGDALEQAVSRWIVIVAGALAAAAAGGLLGGLLSR